MIRYVWEAITSKLTLLTTIVEKASKKLKHFIEKSISKF